MRALKGLAPLLLIGIAGLAWLLFISEPGARWLSKVFAPAPPPGPTVGRVMSVSGSVKRIRGGDVAVIASTPAELHDGERLETDAGASALVLLNSQDEIALSPLSGVAFQLWNEQDPQSAIYLTVLGGDIDLKKPGVHGRAYVVRDGRLYLPGQKAVKKPMALTVLRSAPLDMTLNAPSTEDFEPDSASAAKPAETTSFAGEPETLSNEYIDEMIVARKNQLQKCWLGRLKDKPGLKGQLVLQIEISRRGKVKDVRVTDSTLGDESLNKCVMTVVERIPFRSFRGAEISLSYPIGFE